MRWFATAILALMAVAALAVLWMRQRSTAVEVVVPNAHAPHASTRPAEVEAARPDVDLTDTERNAVQPTAISTADELEEGTSSTTPEPTRPRALNVVVLDQAGAPIEGAVAFDPEDTELASKPTRADGRTVLALGDAPPPVVAAVALGYSQGSASVRPEDELLEIRLDPGTVLEIAVHARADSVRDMRVQINAQSDPFAPLVRPGVEPGGSSPSIALGRTGNATPMALVGGSKPFVTLSGGTRSTSVVYNLDAEPTLLVANLAPGREDLELEVLDPYFFSLHTETIPPLGVGEWRRLDVTLHGAPRDLTGTVVDESGEPLYTVNVNVAFQDVFSKQASTDSQGRFQLPNAWAEIGDLTLSKAEYATLRFEEYALDALPSQYVLEAARTVRVVVLDATGRALDGVVAANRDDMLRVETTSETGTYTLQGLPSGIVGMTITVGGHTTTRELDTAVADTTVTLPVHARLDVVVQGEAAEEAAPGMPYIRLTSPTDPDWSIHEALDEHTGGAGFDVRPGDYVVSIGHFVWVSGTNAFNPLGESVAATAQAGATTLVTLSR